MTTRMTQFIIKKNNKIIICIINKNREKKLPKNSTKKNSLVKPLASEKRRSVRFRDSENSKRRLRIAKPRLMLLEPRELLRMVKEMLEKGKDLRLRRDKESKLISSLQDKNNLPKSKQVWVNKQELKERIT